MASWKQALIGQSAGENYKPELGEAMWDAERSINMNLKLPTKEPVLAIIYGAICELEDGETVEQPEINEPSSMVGSGQDFLTSTRPSCDGKAVHRDLPP